MLLIKIPLAIVFSFNNISDQTRVYIGICIYILKQLSRLVMLVAHVFAKSLFRYSLLRFARLWRTTAGEQTVFLNRRDQGAAVSLI